MLVSTYKSRREIVIFEAMFLICNKVPIYNTLFDKHGVTATDILLQKIGTVARAQEQVGHSAREDSAAAAGRNSTSSPELR